MKVKLGFGETSNKRFLVMVELVVTRVWIPPEPILAFTYDHEDTFLKLVVAADLGLQETTDIVTTILLSCEKPAFYQPWIPLDLTPEQIEILQFSEIQPAAPQPCATSRLRDVPLDFTPNAAQFMDFMMTAPTPFAVLLGPELRFCFSNSAYIDLIKRPPSETLQGKPIREILRGIVGPSYIALMEEVYRTGEPHVRTDALSPRLLPTGKYEDRYYDLIYHPLRNGEEHVVGIMLQVTDVTQRITMTRMVDAREDQLFDQWAELEAIYQNTAVGMTLFDRRSHRILRINQKQADIMRAPIEQLIGKSIADIPQHIPGFKKLLDLVDAGQTVHNTLVHEDAQPHSDSRRSWLVNITPALSATGEVSALSSVFLEVPEEPRSHSDIDEGKGFIADPLESTTDAIYVLDRSWKFIFLNSRARELLPNGDHLLGRNVWEEFPKASQYDAVWENFNRTMTERISTAFFYYYGDPLFAWWDVHTFPAKDGISAFFRNITKQRLDEQTLEDVEEKYRMSLDLNPNVPWIMDAHGQLTDIGVRFQQITGLTREESLGNGFYRAIHPDDIPRMVQYLSEALAAKLPLDLEFRVLRHDMRYIWMRGRATPVFHEDGTLDRYYGSTEDIDELKELREALSLLQTATHFN